MVRKGGIGLFVILGLFLSVGFGFADPLRIARSMRNLAYPVKKEIFFAEKDISWLTVRRIGRRPDAMKKFSPLIQKYFDRWINSIHGALFTHWTWGVSTNS